MTEQFPRPEEALANDLLLAMEQPMAQVREAMYAPGMSQIAATAYAINPLQVGHMNEEWGFHAFYQNAEDVDNAEYEGIRLGSSALLALTASSITERLQEVYATEAVGSDASPLSYLIRPLRQGQEKIIKTGILNNPLHGFFETAKAEVASTLVPVWLAEVVAHTAALQEDGDDEAVRIRLQDAAISIMEGRTMKTNKDMTVEDEVFARAVNMLGSFYGRGTNVDFYTRLFDVHYHGLMAVEYHDFNPANASPEDIKSNKHSMMKRLVADGETFGISGVNPEAIVGREIARNERRLPRQNGEIIPYEELKQMDTRESRRWFKQTDQWVQKLEDKRRTVLVESQRVLVARRTVELMAAGEYDWKSLESFKQLLDTKPLQDRAIELPDVPEQFYDWEFVPPATGEGELRGTCVRDDDAEPHPQEVDITRRDRMYDYVRMWGDGKVARSRIPNLPEDDQYYVAVLPQVVGETVLEHAIADNPAKGRHAVFVWRAESGIGRFGQVQTTWENVFSNNKKQMGRLGARRILHTAFLEDKVLDILTRPADEIQNPRYSY